MIAKGEEIMLRQKKRDFLIRGMPVELYDLLEKSAREHHRSKTQEVIVVLTQGLATPQKPVKKPEPFKWGKKITTRLIQEAIEEGRK
jgi:hypothetical protein